MTKQVQLTESIEASGDQIDREAGVIRNCKILQPTSRNGRRYSADAMEQAQPLYEGARVYIDHLPKGSKSTMRRKGDRWGKIENVRFEEGSLSGDLHYLTKHPMTESILESVEKFGDTGLSHHADGNLERINGELVVTQISKVRSVDFVEETGTNANLFEGAEDPAMSKFKLMTVLQESVSDTAVAASVARLVDSGMDVSAVEFELEEGVEGADRLPSAYGALVESVIESKGVKDGLGVIAGLFAEAKDDEPGDDEKSELVQLREELDAMKAEREAQKAEGECRTLLESLNVEATDVRLSALKAVPAGLRSDLAKSWPKKAGKKPARSSGVSMQEANDEDTAELPKDGLKAALGYGK